MGMLKKNGWGNGAESLLLDKGG